MNNNKKILLIIGAVFTCVGIISLTLILIFVNGDFSKLSTSRTFEEKHYQISAEKIKNINISDSNNAIKLVKSKDNNIYVTYSENKKERYEIYQTDDGILSFNFHSDLKWYEHICVFNFSARNMQIAIPDQQLEDITLTTSNGSISVEDISLKGDISLITSNGDVTIKNIETPRCITVKTDNAPIFATSLNTENLSLKTSNGSISTKDVTSQKDIEAKTSNSTINLNTISAGSEITLESSNGNISGSINDSKSTFSITSSTSNGHNNLPKSQVGTSKILDVDTSNGNIDITFSK